MVIPGQHHEICLLPRATCAGPHACHIFSLVDYLGNEKHMGFRNSTFTLTVGNINESCSFFCRNLNTPEKLHAQLQGTSGHRLDEYMIIVRAECSINPLAVRKPAAEAHI